METFFRALEYEVPNLGHGLLFPTRPSHLSSPSYLEREKERRLVFRTRFIPLYKVVLKITCDWTLPTTCAEKGMQGLGEREGEEEAEGGGGGAGRRRTTRKKRKKRVYSKRHRCLFVHSGWKQFGSLRKQEDEEANEEGKRESGGRGGGCDCTFIVMENWSSKKKQKNSGNEKRLGRESYKDVIRSVWIECRVFYYLHLSLCFSQGARTLRS